MKGVAAVPAVNVVAGTAWVAVTALLTARTNVFVAVAPVRSVIVIV